MKRNVFLSIVALFVFLPIFSQVPIRGTVISAEDKEPVIGASVVVKGTTIGVTTDYDGKFEISLPSMEQDLVISYVGMKTEEMKPKNGMVVVMQSVSQDINEVIVVAYGTAKKSSFTGSAGNFGKEEIGKLQVSNVSKALEGAMAGVQITAGSGQPGSSSSIRVRGVGSMLASSNPLIVLDGVPYEGSLNTINPNDIEAMSVLKDAAANSLYGARGANGVVMITTKKGKNDRVRVSFENRTGFNFKAVPSYNVLTSPQEYYELYWEALRNQQVYSGGKNAYAAGQYASSALVSTLGGYNNYNVAADALVNPLTGRLNGAAALLYHDDWNDEAFRLGFRQEDNLSISGGNDAHQYYVSFGYLNDNSYTDQSNLVRYSGKLRMDQQFTPWLKGGVNLAGQVSSTNSPNTSGSSNIFYQNSTMAPIYPVYRRDEQGNILTDSEGNRLYDYGTTEGHSRPIGGSTNAIDQQRNNIYKGNREVLSAKVYVEAKFLKDFRFTVNFSADRFNTNSTEFDTPKGGDAANVNGRGTKSFSNTGVINCNQLLNWDHAYGKHEFEALLGHEIKSDKVTYLTATKTNFYIPTNPELDNAGTLQSASSGSSAYSLEGFFGQVKYNYNDRYYLSGSYRRDGSSRFHPSVRWGSFWSVGGSWRINQEEFMQAFTFVDDLKLKASFGTQGNDNLGNYLPYLNQYVVLPDNQNSASEDGTIAIPNTMWIFRGNPKLTWEKSNNFNVGVDFKVFNRLSGTVEYFNKKTYDMLYSKPLAPSNGAPTSIWENVMSMRNQGIEVELNYDLLRTKDWYWNVSLNMTHYTNELLKLPPDKNQDGWAYGTKYLRRGASIYNWYGYKCAGVNPEDGSPLFYKDVVDENGRVIGQTITSSTEEATRYEYNKNSIPDLYGGLSSNLNYKNIDFGFSLAYQIGGWVEDTQYQSLMHGGNAGVNWHKDVYQRWTSSNTTTDVPRLQAGLQSVNESTDRFMTKASYLNLKSVTLGYTLPGEFLKKIKMDKVRIYVAGDNLFLLTARKGLDPRQSFNGETSGSTYAALGSCSLGININF